MTQPPVVLVITVAIERAIIDASSRSSRAPTRVPASKRCPVLSFETRPEAKARTLYALRFTRDATRRDASVDGRTVDRRKRRRT